MTQYYIKEDKLPQNLSVRFSAAINERIKTIANFNRYNTEAMFQWYNYLDGIKRYLSKRTIAWDNMGRYTRWPNGTRFISDLGYNVGYSILNDKITNKDFVYIFKVNLAPEEYGLKLPPTLNENKKIIPLTESHIRQMVRETLRRYLQL